MIITTIYDSPCGRLLLGVIDDALCLCDWYFPERRKLIDRRICDEFGCEMQPGLNATLTNAGQQLDEYFAGKRRSFDLPLAFGGTPLRHLVWTELQHIPYGTVTSYGEFAKMLDKQSAVRAIASAIGANPISIFIPCHRVVGKSGALTGYAGGLEAKQFLLKIERR